MDAKMFLLTTKNVYEARHGKEFIFVGHDVANRWSAFFSGREESLEFVDTLEEAETAAHRIFDAGKSCSLKLEWKFILRTEIRDCSTDGS